MIWEAGHHFNGELLGFKFGVWEGGHRVPFIAKWPKKIKEGSTSNQLICNVDMLATFAALTGQHLGSNNASDGVNILPTLFSDPKESIRDHLILAPRFGKNLSVRKGKRMYIGAQGDGGFEFNPNSHASGDVASIEFSGRENSDIEKGKIKDDAPNAQLYNLESDGAQKKNSYNNHPEIVKEMEAILDLYIPKIDRMVKK